MKHENRFDHRYRLCFFDFPSWVLRGTEASYDKHHLVG
jgi:hypothetical protein